MPAAPGLFSPITIGRLDLANRIVISPMCQYAAHEGMANDWHLVHVGNLVLSGAALVFMEATAIGPAGRITANCLGLYDDAGEAAIQRVFQTAKRLAPQVALGIQLSHAGRKAANRCPWEGGGLIGQDQGEWERLAPSSASARDGEAPPRAMTLADMRGVRDAYRQAARRARRIGFDGVELQMAHGYLMHQFLSPLSNERTDAYGGALPNRLRYPLEVFETVRQELGSDAALGVRLSATDWVEGGWTVEEAEAFCHALKARGCDFVDVSSGGISTRQKIPTSPGYQVGFAAHLRAAVGLPVIAVGLITEAVHANAIVAQGQADLVAIARAALYDPRWPWHAAVQLGATVRAPKQLHRGLPQGAPNIFAHEGG